MFSSLLTYAQADSIGIYAVHNGEIVQVEPMVAQATRIGIGKAKLEFDGASSENKFKGEAKFRLYFGVPSPFEAAKYFMFTPSRSIKEFGVCEFDSKKDRRRLTTNRVSMFSATIGTKRAKGLDVDIKEIDKNKYEITIKGEPGEYCIAHFMNGVAGYSGLFDFTLME